MAAHLRRQVADDGYAVVPLLGPAGVAEVRSVLDRFGPAPEDPRTGLFMDTWSADADHKQRLSDALAAIMEPSASAALPGARYLGWTSITKWPGADGAVIAHRDPSFVDEPLERSLSVWCALEDLDEDEGTLMVVPGSHRSAPSVRPHQDSGNLCPAVDAIAVPVPAGSAIVYDHALVHGSGPNRTDRVRTVVSGLVVSSDAVASYALRVGPDVVQFEIDAGFFLEHKIDAIDVDAVLERRRVVRSLPFP